MDIYILSDILKIPVRIVLWNKLHLYETAFVACLLVGVLLSLLISKRIIRPNRYLRKFILGMS